MQRILSNVELDIDLVGETFVQTTQQSTTTSEVNTVLHNVGIQLWRGMLQRREYGILNLRNSLIQTMSNLLITYGHLHRQCGDTVRTVYYIVLRTFLT